MPSPRIAPGTGIALAFIGLLLFGYPVLAAAALDWWPPRAIALLWLGLALIAIGVRRVFERRALPGLALKALPGLSLLGWAALDDAALPLRLLPAAVNATLAVVFLQTLRDERSIIEVGARLMDPRLPDFARPYCRKSTVFWGLFFVVNAGVIGGLAILGSQEAWAAYTARTYFVAITVIATVEFVGRKIHFRNYGGGPIDGLFAALFPARDTAMGRRSAAYLDALRRSDGAADRAARTASSGRPNC